MRKLNYVLGRSRTAASPHKKKKVHWTKLERRPETKNSGEGDRSQGRYEFVDACLEETKKKI